MGEGSSEAKGARGGGTETWRRGTWRRGGGQRGVGGGAGRRGHGRRARGGHGGTQEQYESAGGVAWKLGPWRTGVGPGTRPAHAGFRGSLGPAPRPLGGAGAAWGGGGAIFAQTARACATLRQPWRRSGRPRPGGNSAGRLGRARRRRAPRDRPLPAGRAPCRAILHGHRGCRRAGGQASARVLGSGDPPLRTPWEPRERHRVAWI